MTSSLNVQALCRKGCCPSPNRHRHPISGSECDHNSGSARTVPGDSLPPESSRPQSPLPELSDLCWTLRKKACNRGSRHREANSQHASFWPPSCSLGVPRFQASSSSRDNTRKSCKRAARFKKTESGRVTLSGQSRHSREAIRHHGRIQLSPGGRRQADSQASSLPR